MQANFIKDRLDILFEITFNKTFATNKPLKRIGANRTKLNETC